VYVQEANLGKVAKSCTAQIKGSIFLKINQNYFAHICPEYGLRVNSDLFSCAGWIDIYLLMQWHSYIFDCVLNVQILFGATGWCISKTL